MHDSEHTTHAGEVQGYEETDINMGVVFAGLVILAVLLFGGVTATIVILRTLETRPAMNTQVPSPLAVDETWLVEGPTLQMNPRHDRDVEVAAEKARLESYGELGNVPGMQRAHVPVEVAIDLLLEKKVPYRQEPVVAAATEAGGGDDFWTDDAENSTDTQDDAGASDAPKTQEAP